MRERPKTAATSQILSGWKDIANYLGRGVRTVQRYERLLGLPVRRPAGKSSGSVVATQAELDAWVKASPIREEYRRPNPLPEYPYPTCAIKGGLQEMIRLRAQMFALRSEVTKSLRILNNCVRELQDGLNHGSSARRSLSHDGSPMYRGAERDSLDRNEFHLLAAPTKYSKAS